MTIKIRKNRPPGDEVRRLIRTELDAARKELIHWRDDRSRAIHRLRQSGKRTRAILHLIRNQAPYVYDVENRTQKEIGQRFAYLRDADVMASTFVWLGRRHPRILDDANLRDVGDALEERASRLLGSEIFRLDHRIDQALNALDRAVERARYMPLDKVSRSRICKSVRRGRRQVKKRYTRAALRGRPGDFHEWRRWAKNSSLQLSVTRSLGTGIPAQERRIMAKTAKILGREHDLTILIEWLTQPHRPARSHGPRAPLLEMLIRERSAMQQRALTQGRKLFGIEPIPDRVVVPFPAVRRFS